MSETVQSLIDELQKHDPERTVMVGILLADGTVEGGHIDGVQQVGRNVVLVLNERIY